MGASPLVLQKLFRGQVCEEHLDDSLGILAAAGVGVPHHTIAQDGLWTTEGGREGEYSEDIAAGRGYILVHVCSMGNVQIFGGGGSTMFS